MQVGDKVIWADALDTAAVERGTITKIKGETCWLDGKHKGEDARYVAFMWPARAETELLKVLLERNRLKKAYDDSMALVYQLRNKIIRGEL